MGTAAVEAGRGKHDNGTWGIDKDGISYDKFGLIRTDRLPEKYYRQEFGIAEDKVKSCTVFIEKRQHPKTKNFCYIAVTQFYADTQKSQREAIAVKWISFKEYTRLTRLH